MMIGKKFIPDWLTFAILLVISFCFVFDGFSFVNADKKVMSDNQYENICQMAYKMSVCMENSSKAIKNGDASELHSAIDEINSAVSYIKSADIPDEFDIYVDTTVQALEKAKEICVSILAGDRDTASKQAMELSELLDNSTVAFEDGLKAIGCKYSKYGNDIRFSQFAKEG